MDWTRGQGNSGDARELPDRTLGAGDVDRVAFTVREQAGIKPRQLPSKPIDTGCILSSEVSLRAIKAILLLAAAVACMSCSGDVTEPSAVPTPSPTPTPVPLAEGCQILGGYHAVRVVRNGKEVAVSPVGGWRYPERPTVTAQPIFKGDLEARASTVGKSSVDLRAMMVKAATNFDSRSCPTFTQSNGWEFRPFGECRAFADNTSGLRQQLACRRSITEGLFIRTLVPDPYNPQQAIVIESNWNVSE